MRLSGAVAAAALIAAVAAYWVWCAFAPVRQVALGQPIRHDDFLFTVDSVTRSAQMNGATRYTVTLLVQNQAMRVPYSWSDATVYVTDARGRRYTPVSTGSFTLDAGESRTAQIEFQLPPGASAPLLRFWDGIFMGDVFDGNAYARSAVAL